MLISWQKLKVNSILKIDPFEGEKGTIAREDKEAKEAREQEIILNEEMTSLDLELTELKTLDLSDSDFIDLLAELESSENPSHRRTHKIFQALADQSLLDDELLREQEQANLRERHHNLAQIENARQALKGLKNEELNLRMGINRKRASERAVNIKKAKEKKVTPNLLNTVQVNLKPYNFEKDPIPSTQKMKQYDEDLSHFTKNENQYVSIRGMMSKVPSTIGEEIVPNEKDDVFSSKMLRSKGPVSYKPTRMESRSIIQSAIKKKKKRKQRELVPA